MKLNKITPFATENDTDRHVVMVDGYIQSFATEQEAMDVYHRITPPGWHFDDTLFGCCDYLPPRYRPGNRYYRVVPKARVSGTQEIDLEGYIAKLGERLGRAAELSRIHNPAPALVRWRDSQWLREWGLIEGLPA